MRPLVFGIFLFLIWSVLSTWYYSNFLFNGDGVVENTIPDTGPAENIDSLNMTPVFPDKPGNITLLFDYNKSVVKNSSELDDFANLAREYLLADTASCLMISGHTCSMGSDSYNLELGQKRAEAVKEYLSVQGFSGKCLKVISRGESEPAAENTTESGRSKNRRVELAVMNH